MAKTPNKKKKKEDKVKPLNKYIRNELRTACALKGSAEMRSGKSKRVAD